MEKAFYKNMIHSCKTEIKITKECIKQLKAVNPKHPYISKYEADINNLSDYMKELKKVIL